MSDDGMWVPDQHDDWDDRYNCSCGGEIAPMSGGCRARCDECGDDTFVLDDNCQGCDDCGRSHELRAMRMHVPIGGRR